MAVTSGFFNSINHDRLYDAEQLSSIFDGIVLDGVYESIGTAFMVSAINDEMAVKIGTGRAWFDHIWVLNDSEFVVNLDPAHVALPRIDAIVLDIDKRTNNRTGSIKYIRGDYSYSPVRPSLIKEDSAHVQYPIAYIEVASGSNVTIDQTKITRTVGTSECPYVIGVLTVINADTYWKQLETEFNIWWDGIKDTISSENLLDIELRLQNVEKKTNEVYKNVVLAPDYVYEQETLVTYDNYDDWFIAAYSNIIKPIMDFILPDKKFITLFDYQGGFYCSKVYDLDDIKKSKNTPNEIVNIQAGAKKIASLPGHAYGDYWFSNNVSVIKSETETYPVNVYVYYFRPVYSSTSSASSFVKNAYADVIKITLSSDHVISYSTVSSVKTPLNNTYDIGSYYNYYRQAHTTKFPLRVFGNDYTFITATLQPYNSSYDNFFRLMFQNVSYNKDTLVLNINKESSIDYMFSSSTIDGFSDNDMSLIGYGRSDNSGYVLMFSLMEDRQDTGKFTAYTIITGDPSFENVEYVEYNESNIGLEEFKNTYFSNIRFCSDIEVTVYKERHKYVYTDKLIPSKSLCESTLSGGTPKFIRDRQLGWPFTVYPMMKIADDTFIGFESMNNYPFPSNESDSDKLRITLYNVYNTSTDADRVSKYKNSTMIQCSIRDGEDYKILGSEYFIIWALSHNYFPVRAFDDSIMISSYGVIGLKFLENFKNLFGNENYLVDNFGYVSRCSEPIMLVKKRS